MSLRVAKLERRVIELEELNRDFARRITQLERTLEGETRRIDEILKILKRKDYNETYRQKKREAYHKKKQND